MTSRVSKKGKNVTVAAGPGLFIQFPQYGEGFYADGLVRVEFKVAKYGFAEVRALGAAHWDQHRL